MRVLGEQEEGQTHTHPNTHTPLTHTLHPIPTHCFFPALARPVPFCCRTLCVDPRISPTRLVDARPQRRLARCWWLLVKGKGRVEWMGRPHHRGWVCGWIDAKPQRRLARCGVING